MKQQQHVIVTGLLLEVLLARAPWVSETWQDEVKELFSDFDLDGESAIESNVADSELPDDVIAKIMQACVVHGLLAVRNAIKSGLEMRPPEIAERDDIEAYKSTINF